MSTQICAQTSWDLLGEGEPDFLQHFNPGEWSNISRFFSGGGGETYYSILTQMCDQTFRDFLGEGERHFLQHFNPGEWSNFSRFLGECGWDILQHFNPDVCSNISRFFRGKGAKLLLPHETFSVLTHLLRPQCKGDSLNNVLPNSKYLHLSCNLNLAF